MYNNDCTNKTSLKSKIDRCRLAVVGSYSIHATISERKGVESGKCVLHEDREISASIDVAWEGAFEMIENFAIAA